MVHAHEHLQNVHSAYVFTTQHSTQQQDEDVKQSLFACPGHTHQWRHPAQAPTMEVWIHRNPC